MKRVLITGITGYIGSHLAKALMAEYEVCGLVRTPLHTAYIAGFQDRLRLLPVDGTYESIHRAVQAAQPDLVYHLAAYYTGSHGPQDTPKLVESNVTFGAYLLEAMSACGVPALAYATTYMTHYRGADYCPVNLYAATKQAFSALLAYYTDAGILRAAALVISDTYGPGDRRPKVLNVVKRAAETGERTAFSTGNFPYDVVYIDDIVSAFCIIGEQLLEGAFRNEMFQAVPDSPLSVRETVEKMLQVNHLTLNAGWGERPAAEREMTELVRRYPTPPGWKPKVPLDVGLKKMYGASRSDR